MILLYVSSNGGVFETRVSAYFRAKYLVARLSAVVFEN